MNSSLLANDVFFDLRSINLFVQKTKCKYKKILQSIEKLRMKLRQQCLQLAELRKINAKQSQQIQELQRQISEMKAQLEADAYDDDDRQSVDSDETRMSSQEL